MGIKVVIAFTFTLLLAGAGVLVYQPMDSGMSSHVHAMAMPSDSCVACHTNPQIINALATPVETAAGGG